MSCSKETDQSQTVNLSIPKILNFTSVQVDGSEFDVATLGGEDVLFWFWDPNWTICRREAPTVAEANTSIKDLTIVGVAREGDGLDIVSTTLNEWGLTGLINLVDLDGSVWERFGVFGQPATVLVTTNGDVTGHMGDLTGDAFKKFVEANREAWSSPHLIFLVVISCGNACTLCFSS